MRLIRLSFWPLAALLARCRPLTGMRLVRALPEVKSPARLNLNLNAHWNNNGAFHGMKHVRPGVRLKPRREVIIIYSNEV